MGLRIDQLAIHVSQGLLVLIHEVGTKLPANISEGIKSSAARLRIRVVIKNLQQGFIESLSKLAIKNKQEASSDFFLRYAAFKRTKDCMFETNATYRMSKPRLKSVLPLKLLYDSDVSIKHLHRHVLIYPFIELSDTLFSWERRLTSRCRMSIFQRNSLWKLGRD
jgi:hypothetical protein